jgi:predicted O-linked N-acetylglucosamine transferase (SPINDLY family)
LELSGIDIAALTRSAIDRLRSGNLQEAERVFRDILEIHPSNVAALHFIGVIFFKKKDYVSSIAYIKKALEFGPTYVDAYNNLGIVLQETGQIDEAIPCYEKAIQLDPNFDRAYYNLGIALKEKWRLNEAVTNYQKAIEINSHLIEAYNNLGLALQEQGRVNEAEDAYRQALHLKPDFALCHSNLLLLMNYNCRHDAQSVFTEHLRFAKQFAEPLASSIPPHTNDPTPDRRLRIGYVSPDFRRHSVNYFIEPVLASHNHEQFEIVCYSDVLKPDTVTEQLRGYANRWRTIAGISDEDVSGLIRQDRIDILVDLAGHTGNNRMLTFARKPAPVLVTGIGYPPTTGLSTIDYKIVDNFTNPLREADRFYTEKLLRFPGCFVVYLPDKDCPAVKSLPAFSAGNVTFGSFNNFAKVTTEVADLWARILLAVPGSRLMLKWKCFSDNVTRQNAINMICQRRIDSERIILETAEPSPMYLASYNSVDIGLDTFPFNGLTTTCEALWMGVPVITLAGTAYASRAGASLLSNIGMTELIAGNFDEYVLLAVNLASDINRLQSYRERLRNMMRQSPLMNEKQFTSNLENCYRKIWQNWCELR